VRWDVELVRDNLAFSLELEERLRKDERLRNVVVSASTGRVLIEYDPALEESGVAGDTAETINAVIRESPAVLRGVSPSGKPAKRVRATPFDGETLAAQRHLAFQEAKVMLIATPVIVLALTTANPLLVLGTIGAIAGSAAMFLRSLRARREGQNHAALGRSVTEHLAPELRIYRKPLIISGVLTVLSIIFSLSRYVLVGRAVDTVLMRDGSAGVVPLRQNARRIVGVGTLMIVMTMVEGIVNYLGSRIWRRVSAAIEHNLRLRTYAMVQRAEMEYLQNTDPSELNALVIADVAQIGNLFSIGWDILRAITTMGVVATAFLFVAPEIAWVSMLGIPVTLAAITFLQNRMMPRQRALQRETAKLNATTTTSSEGLATIKSFTAEKRQLGLMAQHSRAYQDQAIEVSRFSASTAPLIELSVMTGIAATVIAGGVASRKEVTVGQYSMMIMMSRQLLGPLAELGRLMEGFQRSYVGLQRLFHTLDTMPLEDRGELPLDRKKAKSVVTYQNVRFSYEDGREVLHDVSLKFKPGKTTAIVGPTGSGKSTLLRLLVAFRRPTGGEIQIGKQPVSLTRTDDLRRAFAFVSQEVYLFATTIGENIRFARPDASQEEVENAARIAAAHDFITALPQGYETNVGDRGVRLSGGERQRIAIARALLSNAPILVFDEATSQLDNETEDRFYRTLNTDLPHRTKIIVAHRLAAARMADSVYVLEDGRVCEEGPHAKLVQAGGLYATLWRLQVQDGLAQPEPRT
jgi:ATP-binding cassette subfamily B protein